MSDTSWDGLVGEDVNSFLLYVTAWDWWSGHGVRQQRRRDVMQVAFWKGALP